MIAVETAKAIKNKAIKSKQVQKGMVYKLRATNRKSIHTPFGNNFFRRYLSKTTGYSREFRNGVFKMDFGKSLKLFLIQLLAIVEKSKTDFLQLPKHMLCLKLTILRKPKNKRGRSIWLYSF